MKYYTEDGQEISEAEAMKIGNYRVFRDEADAVKFFDKRAEEMQGKADRDYKNTTSPLARLATSVVNPGMDTGPTTSPADAQKAKLIADLNAKRITPFEYKKAIDALENDAADTYGKAD